MASHEIEYPIFHDSLDEVPPPSVSTRLIGHEQTLARILNLAEGGHHGIIMCGTQGIGKATTAFHVCNHLLSGSDGACANIDPDRETYRKIAQIAHPNLLYLTRPLKDDRKGFKTVITVDEVRRLQRFLGMTSSGSGRRIVIVDCLEDMNKNAANAILKLLEEPPVNTLFLLISHAIGGLPPTIRSRCQVVKFASLSPDEIEQALGLVAGTILETSTLPQLAATAGGSVRQALMMALNGGLELRDSLEQFMSAANFDTAAAHKLAEVAGARGDDTHNGLLRQMVLNGVRDRAYQCVHEGNLDRAEKIARIEAELSERFRIADGFNLDRKQEFLITLDRVHTLFHGA